MPPRRSSRLRSAPFDGRSQAGQMWVVCWLPLRWPLL
ncbi:hypothetical protein BU14_0562s0015 [Porphyra umbilicalis]|uniref:Uncharacterized protein n=1 Tax=Porphyra umbilicalis TaxID=2786 RepID=A0A1X6NSE7_PORUM|nr:hypothetical protein BU14_0562s0015 [Porphyra umbilicalis]|eukprot:OSX71303.1 hypothetical protein BU14_0562s0015 [Porphyra umbilicalis]